MNFGQTIEAMKNGKKVARDGWNGNGMFIYLVEGGAVEYRNLRGNAAKHITNESTGKPFAACINSHIDMRTADGSVAVGWLASQADMLAEDWQIV